MFYHAYDSYMAHAYPMDELLPITCRGIDNFGSYALTLIDSISTLAVLGNKTEFSRAIHLVGEAGGKLSFDIDVSVSVFETNIRVLGGLLSSHLLAIDPDRGLTDGYTGVLLDLALDLANRLLPAPDAKP